MVQDHQLRNRKKGAGTITAELGIAVPLLMLMMVGAADFARLFFHVVTLDNASLTGAFYGAQNTVLSADYDGMVLAAKNDARDLTGVSATPDRYCDCPNKTAKNCFTDTCTGFYGGTGLYGLPRAYTELAVHQTFSPLLPWPGIPNPVVINERTYMRVR